MKTSLRKSAGHIAFTRVDLLMVIACLGLLAALFLPALTKAREEARKVECSSNLQYVGLGFQDYGYEHNGRLMPPISGVNPQGMEMGYDETLNPFLARLGLRAKQRKLFICPSQKRTSYPRLPGYGMNAYCGNVDLTSMPGSFRGVLLAETRGPDGTGSHLADPQNHSPGELDDARHNGCANYLFADGHVFGWRPADAVDYGWWDASQTPANFLPYHD